MTHPLVASPLAGWLSPLSNVPDRVFADGLMGDGLAVDPTEGNLHAPCDATVVSIHTSRHALTVRSDAGAELLIHIGVDTVALRGSGFDIVVEEGARVTTGQLLARFDLDRLVQAAPAVMTPIVLTNLDRFAITEMRGEGLVGVGDTLFRIVPREQSDAAERDAGALQRREVAVMLEHGIHARPAARIAERSRQFHARAWLEYRNRRASVTSIMELMGLGIGGPGTLTIAAEGAEAGLLIDALARLLCESEAAAAPLPTPRARSTGQAANGLVGVSASPGLAIGEAIWIRDVQHDFEQAGAGREIEREHFATACRSVCHELDAAAQAGGAGGAILAAHRALLEEPALVARVHHLVDEGASAAGAIATAFEEQASVLRSSGNRRIAERADDLRDVARRLIGRIVGVAAVQRPLKPGSILLARELLPSELLALDPSCVAGICLVGGGPTSHVAILAAGMGVPMVVALGEAIAAFSDGITIVVDGDNGIVQPHPDPAAIAAAQKDLDEHRRRMASARAGGSDPCRTADGIEVGIYANIGSVNDARAAAAESAEGCGLLRTEFLFLDRPTAPSLEEQREQYQAIAHALGDKPLVVRLLDVGGDKPAPYLSIPAEENPALGLRGIRVGLAHPDILETQIRAILSMMPRHRCRIMVPMVADVRELEAVRQMVERLDDRAGASPVPVGVMVETPSAAIGAGVLAATADFLSIGTNDLTQYSLAMDRANPAVAGSLDGLHPTVLRLIAITCEGAARHGRPVSVCGGLAADPLAAPLLIGMGVRTLSVPPSRVVATKALVASLTIDACREHVAAALGERDAQAVRARARRFAEGTGR